MSRKMLGNNQMVWYPFYLIHYNVFDLTCSRFDICIEMGVFFCRVLRLEFFLFRRILTRLQYSLRVWNCAKNSLKQRCMGFHLKSTYYCQYLHPERNHQSNLWCDPFCFPLKNNLRNSWAYNQYNEAFHWGGLVLDEISNYVHSYSLYRGFCSNKW